MTPLIFPDVQAAAIEAVRGVVGGSVASRIPPSPPHGHVRVWRSGGAARDVAHDLAVVSYQVWSPDEAHASERAREVQQALHDLRNTATSHGWLTFRDDLAAPIYLPNPDREGFIYQGSVTITARITERETHG